MGNYSKNLSKRLRQKPAIIMGTVGRNGKLREWTPEEMYERASPEVQAEIEARARLWEPEIRRWMQEQGMLCRGGAECQCCAPHPAL